MTPSMSQVFGWSPVKGEDDIVLDAALLRPLVTTLNQTHISDFTHHGKSSPPATPPALVKSDLDVPSKDEPIHRRDPEWVARPRNPFIIFRCNFSKTNCNPPGKRVRRPRGVAPPDKTVSKKAAEAWHALPDEDKDYYKELAEVERQAHAKMYPNYRFKPAKRKSSKKRTVSSNKPPSDFFESAPPSPPQTTFGDDSDCTSPISYPLSSATSEFSPAPLPQPCVPSSNDMASVKAGRRRSASVPSLPYGQHPQFLGGPKLNMKRSRSVMGRPSIRSPINEMDTSTWEDQNYGASYMHKTVDGYYTPEEPHSDALCAPQLYREPSNLSIATSSTDYIPPTLTMSSSTLANWNGQLSGSQYPPALTPPAGSTLFETQSLQYPDYASQHTAESSGDSQYATSFGNWSSSDLWSLSTGSDTASFQLQTPVESPTADMFYPPFISSSDGVCASSFPEDIFALQNFDYTFDQSESLGHLYQPTY